MSYAYLAAELLKAGDVPAADSLMKLTLYYQQHVSGGEGAPIGEAFSDLGYANLLAGRNEQAERFQRKSLAIIERELPPDDPLRGLASMRLGETYMARGRTDEAEAPLALSIDVADSGAVRKSEQQHLCQEMAVEARCCLADCDRQMDRVAEAESLFAAALRMVESARKPLNLPQTDSLFDRYILMVGSSGRDSEAGSITNRIRAARERRDREYARKQGQ